MCRELPNFIKPINLRALPAGHMKQGKCEKSQIYIKCVLLTAFLNRSDFHRDNAIRGLVNNHRAFFVTNTFELRDDEI